MQAAATLAGAGRRLWRRPRFTALAILGLALGVGVNTAAFSVLYAVLLEPLPYRDPERVFLLHEAKLAKGEGELNLSVPALREWRRRSRCFDALSGRVPAGLTLSLGGEPEQVTALLVEPGHFRLLGVEPALGRTFAAAGAGPAEVILAHSLWQRRFGSDPEVVGRSVRIGDVPFTVAGVLPADLPPAQVAIWLPLDLAPVLFPQLPRMLEDPESRIVQVWARLRPEVEPAVARSELAAVARQLAADLPATHQGVSATLTPVRERAVRGVRPVLLLLQAGAAAMLLIVCANLANLLLAEGTARTRELAIRSAVGATPAGIFRQLVVETVLISLAGGVAGLAVAAALLRLLIAGGGALPFHLPFRDQIDVDATVLVVALAAAAGAGVLTAILPAARLARADVAALLKGAAGGPASGGRLAGQHVLIVLQTALTVALLVTAVLLARSARRLQQVDPGFSARSVLVMSVFLPGDRYAGPEDVARFYAGVFAAIGALPGVERVSAGLDDPLAGNSCSLRVTAAGSPAGAPREVECQKVAAGYFETLGVTLAGGRTFGAADYRPGAGAVVVNRRLADLLWPGEDPLGRLLELRQGSRGSAEQTAAEVVGVVADVRSAIRREASPLIYLPQYWLFMSILIRTTGEPQAMADAARRALWTVDPQQPVSALATLDELVTAQGAAARFSVLLSGLVSIFSLVIGALGLFGVLSRHVGHRRRELAIRLALGAVPGPLVRRLAGRALALTAAGCALGLALALAAGRWLQSLLFEVSAGDPWTFAAVTLVMLAVALLAAWGPSRRAAAVNPAASLRAAN